MDLSVNSAAARCIAICPAKRNSASGMGYIRRGQIPNRISIDQRPQIVARKGRFGDWEADTIVGARHKGGILSAVERTKLTRLRKLDTKAAAGMKDSSIELLATLAGRARRLVIRPLTKHFSNNDLLHFQVESAGVKCYHSVPLKQRIDTLRQARFSWPFNPYSKQPGKRQCAFFICSRR